MMDKGWVVGKCNCFFSYMVQFFFPILIAMLIAFAIQQSADAVTDAFSAMYFISSPVTFGV